MMRSAWLVLGVSAVIVACSDDGDSGGFAPVDAAGLSDADARTPDATGNGGTDADASAPDAAHDAGGPDADAGSTTCDPGEVGIAFPEMTFTAVEVATGAPLVEPVGIAFDEDGELTVANSLSWIGVSSAAGSIVRIDEAGGVTTLSADNLLRGPSYLAWSTSATSPFAGELIVTTEDADEAGLTPFDVVVSVATDGSVREIAALSEGLDVAIGPGGAWGEAPYVVGRAAVGRGDGPYELWTVQGDGTAARFPVSGDGRSVRGMWTLEFSTLGSDLGSDPALYIGTFNDPLSPGSAVAIYRADPTGTAELIVADDRLRGPGLVASEGGPFGEALYTATSTAIYRVDVDTGDVDVFATGLVRGTDLAIGPDDTMYLTDAAQSAIYAIRPCP